MTDETPADLSELERLPRTVEWSDPMILLAKAYLETHSDEEFRANPQNVRAIDEIVALSREMLAESDLEFNDATLYAGLTGVRTAFIVAVGTMDCAAGPTETSHVLSHLFTGFNHYFGPIFEALRMNDWLPPEVHDPTWRPADDVNVPDMLEKHLHWLDDQAEYGNDPDDEQE